MTSTTTDAAPAGDSAEYDFVAQIAAPFPLGVVAWILGVRDADVAPQDANRDVVTTRSDVGSIVDRVQKPPARRGRPRKTVAV